MRYSLDVHTIAFKHLFFFFLTQNLVKAFFLYYTFIQQGHIQLLKSDIKDIYYVTKGKNIKQHNFFKHC